MADPRKPNGGLDDVARRVASTRRRVRQLESPDGAQLNQVVQRVYTAQSTADTATTKANTAQSTAETAQSTATTAQSTATSANTTAQQASTDAATANTNASNANTAAQTAQQQAQAAQTAVAAKTKTTWSTAAPSNTANPGTADGDTWFVTVSTGGAAKAQYRWTASSSSWVLTPIDGAALQNVVADNVKAGVLDGITINGVTVNGGIFQTKSDSTNRYARMQDSGVSFFGPDLVSGVQTSGSISVVNSKNAEQTFNKLSLGMRQADGKSNTVTIGSLDTDGVYPTGNGYWDLTTWGAWFTTCRSTNVFADKLYTENSSLLWAQRVFRNSAYGMDIATGTGTITTTSVKFGDGTAQTTAAPPAPLTGNTAYSGSLAAMTSDTLTVNFPSGRFSAVPTVNANGSNSRVTIGISSVSATSVTFALGNWTSGNVASLRVYWTATPNQ